MFASRTEGLSIAVIGLMFISRALGDCRRQIIESEYYGILGYNFTCQTSTEDLRFFTNINVLFRAVLNLKDIKNIGNAVNDIEPILHFNDVAHLYLKLSDSNLTEVPSELFNFDNLRGLELTNNNLPIFNLNILTFAKNLETLNASHNGIEKFKIEPTSDDSTKKLQVIDLSYNKFDRVPDNCFYGTRKSLQILDLSNNEISSIAFYEFSSLNNLKTLRLSHNKLVDLGLIFDPMQNLRNLYLDHNQIENINEEIFAKLTLLTKIDVSFNNIKLVEDRTFGALTNLVDLNLGYNRIDSIKEILLRNNTLLETLNLSYNNLSYIEPDIFSGKNNLIHLNLEGVYGTAIQANVFTGLKVNTISLAGSTINRIDSQVFSLLGSYLRSLNLSSCGIRTLSKTAFDLLTNLNELDLSNNNLTEVTFQSIDLENLAKLNLSNNSINILDPETFQNLISLTELDISNNEIKTIQPMTFKNLKILQKFNISNNEIDLIIQSNTFFGLENVQKLELVNTIVTRWDSFAFSGLNNLKVLNASHGVLAYIDYYAFTGVSNIETLDLSFNEIQQFNVKLLLNKNLREIYLNHNQLGSILNSSFEGLDSLHNIDLSYNYLVSVDSTAFSHLHSLRHLDFSHNPNIKLDGNVFNDLVLDTLWLKNVSNKVNFDSGNITITNLVLSSSGLSNVTSLNLQKIKQLRSLDLSMNNITVLDRYSFADGMSTLYSIDLSNNNLVHINPGTFLHLQTVEILNLSYNRLENFLYGTLKGLYGLKTLDLSNNYLYNFKFHLLHNLESISSIYLENNKIYSLGLPKYDNKYNITVSIGGNNNLSCEDLMELKTRFPFCVITASTLHDFTENIDGVPCTSYSMSIELPSLSDVE